MKTLFILILSICCCGLNIFADSRYYNKYNGYDDWSGTETKVGKNGTMVCENSSAENIFNLIKIPDDVQSFRFEIKLANETNVEGRNLVYIDKSGQQVSTDISVWGIVWLYQDSNNFHFLKLECDNHELDELYDEKSVSYQVGTMTDGLVTELKSGLLCNNINLSDGFSRFKVIYSENGSIHLYTGIRDYELLYDYIPDFKMTDNLKIGYFAGPGVRLNMDKSVIKYILPNLPDTSEYKMADLTGYFASSKDELEGIWSYFDRNISSRNVKLGGKYTVAIIRNGNDYDIIYISGQKVEARRWKPGSVKGHLSPTPFVGNYNLVWYDSLNSELSDDTYVQLLDGNLLEVNFPTIKSKIRFLKE